MPVIDWQLACHDRRSAVVPILDDLKYVAALLLGERGEAPIIQDQQIDTRQALEEPCMTTVAACECERIEQPRYTVEGGLHMPLAQCRGQPNDPCLSMR
jgi:hypothetical protein